MEGNNNFGPMQNRSRVKMCPKWRKCAVLLLKMSVQLYFYLSFRSDYKGCLQASILCVCVCVGLFFSAILLSAASQSNYFTSWTNVKHSSFKKKCRNPWNILNPWRCQKFEIHWKKYFATSIKIRLSQADPLRWMKMFNLTECSVGICQEWWKSTVCESGAGHVFV